jgi:hypothetical protein
VKNGVYYHDAVQFGSVIEIFMLLFRAACTFIRRGEDAVGSVDVRPGGRCAS